MVNRPVASVAALAVSPLRSSSIRFALTVAPFARVPSDHVTHPVIAAVAAVAVAGRTPVPAGLAGVALPGAGFAGVGPTGAGLVGAPAGLPPCLATTPSTVVSRTGRPAAFTPDTPRRWIVGAGAVGVGVLMGVCAGVRTGGETGTCAGSAAALTPTTRAAQQKMFIRVIRCEAKR
jgi:hypothetical protein